MENENTIINVTLPNGNEIDLETVLNETKMTDLYNLTKASGNETMLKSVIETAKNQYMMLQASKKSSNRVSKEKHSKHWDTPMTNEVKALKQAFSGLSYLAGFIQNNNLLDLDLNDIISATIHHLRAENGSNHHKGKESKKYEKEDYDNIQLFISTLVKDTNSDLYKWLASSKLSRYERMVYTKKEDKKA